MNKKFSVKLTAWVAVLSLAATGCLPSLESAAKTAVANAWATEQSNMLTRAASSFQTSQVEIPQTLVAAGKTKAVELVTQVPAYLTPARPGTGYAIHMQDIILFQVDKAINVREAAYRFSTSSQFLVQWNQAKYPSITGEESMLQPGWTIVIFFGDSGRWDLVPYSAEAWNAIPGCGGIPATAADEITCGEVTLEFVSEKGRFKPECLPTTVVGEYTVQSRYQGPVLYRGGVPFVYGVYLDAARNQVVLGPGVIRNRSDVLACGG